MFRYFTLDNFNFENKVVAVRVDINSPIKNKKIVMNQRIKDSAITIKELVKKGAKVIILAHQGRPKKDDCVSLKDHSEFLSKEIGKKIKFFDKTYSIQIEKEIMLMNSKDVFMLENLRFNSEEMNTSKQTNKILELEKLLDFYVFDAFSLAHRDQTSVTGFKKTTNVCGRLMQKELMGLSLISKSKKPHMFVFGGAKPDDLVELLESHLKSNEVDLVLLTGVIGEIVLHLKGYYIGCKFDYLEKNKFLNSLKRIKILLNKYNDKILYPVDVAYLDKKGKRHEINVKDLNDNKNLLDEFMIQDIGSETVKRFGIHMKNAGSIYFKGPAGNFEVRGLTLGTSGILKQITNSGAFTFMGGGHSVTAADDFKVLDKFSYVSLAGGALVNYLAGKTLPGISSLENSFERYEGDYEDFLVVGSNVTDLGISTKNDFNQIHLGDKVRVEEDFKKTYGGGGLNVSVCLSRLGSKIGYLGKISEENSGEIKQVLIRNKIDLIKSKLSKRPCAKSVIIDSGDKDRVIFTYRGQNAFLDLNDFKLDDIKAKNLYLTSLTGKSFETLYKLIKLLKKKNKDSLVCYNPSIYLIKNERSRLKALIKNCDILVLNFEEAEYLTNKNRISSCLKEICLMGPKVAVITDGKNGSYAYNGSKEYYQKARIPKKIIDATGAGDSFGGTFFYFYAKGFGIEESMKFATKNASSVVEYKGSQLGLKYYEDLIR